MTLQTEVYCPNCHRETPHNFYEETVECDFCQYERDYDAELRWQYQFAEEV